MTPGPFYPWKINKMRFIVLFLSIIFIACQQEEMVSIHDPLAVTVSDRDLMDKANSYLGVVEPYPQPPAELVDLVELGDRLFREPGLSGDGKTSCQSCHRIESAGVDHLSRSRGVFGRMGARNTPPIAHQSYLTRHSWEGKHTTLAAQVQASLANPNEMGGLPANTMMDMILQSDTLSRLFHSAFPGEISEDVQVQVGQALTTFLQTVVLPTRFDAFLKGDGDALTSREKKGLDLFLSKGCVPCHSGPAVGGQQFQRFGIFRDYEPFTGSDSVDKGLAGITKNPSDDRVFRVAPLRLVSQTAPYFHDGSVETLEEAVWIMGKIQLNQNLTDEEVDHIVSFLHTLSPDTTYSLAEGR